MTWWRPSSSIRSGSRRQPEYVFHHPLIRAVAYESQLKSDRAEMHRRVAAAIEQRDPASADENAALDRRTSGGRRRSARRVRLAHACRQRGRPTATSPRRGLSWERARQVADALPADDPDRAAMRIAAAHHVVRDRLSSPCRQCRRPLRRIA